MTQVLTDVVTTDKTIAELYKAFNKLNEAYYNNELPYPYIVILETLKKNAYGWFTPNKIWKNNDETIEMHEIAMSAEFMSRGFYEVIQTLHHEMIHLYCHIHKIKDVDNGKYHNMRFKLECLDRGFCFDGKPNDKLGWCSPKLTDKTKEVISGFGLDEKAFSLARSVAPKKKSKSSPVAKYKCYNCNIILRGKSGITVICGECEEELTEE